MIAVFCIGAGTHPLNDYFDYEVDKIVHPKRPLPSGVFRPISALYMCLILFIVSLLLSLFINIVCFSMNLLGIGLIFLYELSLKNKGLAGNALVAFAASLSFTYGGAIVGDVYRPTVIALIAFFIFFGREIIMDVRDFEGDKLSRTTLPGKIGKRNAVYVGSTMIIISLLLLFVPFFNRMFGIWYVLLAIPLMVFTFYTIALSIVDIKNVGKTAEMLRLTMILGLLLILFGIFT